MMRGIMVNIQIKRKDNIWKVNFNMIDSGYQVFLKLLKLALFMSN